MLELNDGQAMERIAQRIKGREAANKLLEAVDKRKMTSPPFRQGFYRRMCEASAESTGDVANSKPEPIARLGKTRVPFGKYKSQPFDNVPVEYLDWLCREQEEFYADLRKYLTHPELAARRGILD